MEPLLSVTLCSLRGMYGVEEEGKGRGRGQAEGAEWRADRKDRLMCICV